MDKEDLLSKLWNELSNFSGHINNLDDSELKDIEQDIEDLMDKIWQIN